MPEERITIAISPCPNDTYLFGPLALGWVRTDFPIKFLYEDIETLNRWALKGDIPVIKLSFALLPEVVSRYQVLPVGAALGRGCGPVLIASQVYSPEEIPKKRILLPGEHTTAHLLFRLAFPEARRKIFVPYHEIFPRLRAGEAEAGVIIHESRFVFQEQGFVLLQDLGAWWEEKTGLPIPLGGLFARRDLPQELIRSLVKALRESLSLAKRRFSELYPFIQSKAQEMSPEVIRRHIATYVTDFTQDLGEEGYQALQALARCLGMEETDFLWRDR